MKAVKPCQYLVKQFIISFIWQEAINHKVILLRLKHQNFLTCLIAREKEEKNELRVEGNYRLNKTCLILLHNQTFWMKRSFVAFCNLLSDQISSNGNPSLNIISWIMPCLACPCLPDLSWAMYASMQIVSLPTTFGKT